MKCCKTCRHTIREEGCFVPYVRCCKHTKLVTHTTDRIKGDIIITKACRDVIDLCDREGYYEPNLIQKFKNLFTGEN